MPDRPHSELSRRERQIMDIVYRRGRANTTEVREDLPADLTDSAVRTMLRRMEEKGHLTHTEEGRRYIYHPTLPPEEAREGALDRLVETFFEGSDEKAALALLGRASGEIDEEELERLTERIERAREEGR